MCATAHSAAPWAHAAPSLQALLRKELKEFLIGLAMSWIMEKEGGGLDAKAVTTVKLRGNYKGKAPVMQACTIRSLAPYDSAAWKRPASLSLYLVSA